MALASMLHRHSVSRPEPQCGPGVPDRSPLTLRVQVIATAFKLDRICSANYERFLNIQISDFVIVGLENNRDLTFKNCQKPERPCLRVVISSDLHLRPSLHTCFETQDSRIFTIVSHILGPSFVFCAADTACLQQRRT